MPYIIASQLDEIRRICRENGVRRLDFFGAGTNVPFVPASSDLDFFIDLG